MHLIEGVDELTSSERSLGQSGGKLVEHTQVKVELLHLIILNADVNAAKMIVIIEQLMLLKGHGAPVCVASIDLEGDLYLLPRLGL